jgi:LPXTG-site transpeptidase (sortase) family protein
VRLRRTLGRFIAAALAAAFVAAPVVVDAGIPQSNVFPHPSRQSVLHRSQESGVRVASLSIPAIGLDEVVRSGVSLSVIDRGVAQWAGTVTAGGDGNVVLAGHRTTHTHPFEHIDELAIGDLIYLTDGSGFAVMYRVAESFVVDPADIWITYDRDHPTLTLFACHPKGSSRYRLVVTADLVAGRLIA